MSSFGTGLIPRDYGTHPVGCYSFAPPFPAESLIPENEWAERLAEQKANKASLLDLRNDNYDVLKSLNQGQYHLCWAFSSTKAVMYVRAFEGQPAETLSAWYVAGNIKGWRDQGGWGASSLEFIVNSGVPAYDLCPSYSKSAVKEGAVENAAQHKVTEWFDGSDNRDLARQQMISSLLVGIPCVVDLNWMGHSMCCIAVESLNPLTVVFDNSWATNGDPLGLYRATGSKAIPDGLAVPRVVKAATV